MPSAKLINLCNFAILSNLPHPLDKIKKYQFHFTFVSVTKKYFIALYIIHLSLKSTKFNPIKEISFFPFRIEEEE